MPDFDSSFLTAEQAIASPPGRLVDAIDRLLDVGLVLRGDLMLSVADVDLVRVALELVLGDPDTLANAQPPRSGNPS